MKPFTVVAALLFLLIAIGHVYRAYAGIDVTVAGHVVPMAASWIAAVVTAFLGVMLFVECPRGLGKK